MNINRTSRGCLALAAVMLAWCLPVHATNTMSVTWYTIQPTDPDVLPNSTLCCGNYSDEVQTALGPDGLPVLNTSYGGPAISDVNSQGELTWWSPAFNPNVVKTGTGTVALPLNYATIFPPNGTGTADGPGHGYQAALFSATLTPATTESISFSVGADDVAFVYLNGLIECDLGGVHADSPGSCTTGTLKGGSANTLEVFYADLQPSAAALTFTVTTSNVTTTPPGGGKTGVPEPGSLALFGTALFALRLTRRRRS
jgi:hypothetical protein